MPQPWPDRGAAADLAACRATLRAGSRSFLAASLLLPRRVRDPAAAVYAFCREADDAVDLGAVDLGGSADAVARMRERLDRVYAGQPLPAPADRALARVVARHDIPRALPEALLEGFEWDAEGRQYEDLPGLLAYAARVAGSVGAMMVVLMGVRVPEVVARACDLGVAMQLSNIARDVGEDARAGRLYLPLQWLREAGVEPQAWLARPACTEGVGAVVQRLLRIADELYARADSGIARLPAACRPGIRAARLLYAEIGREVERAGLELGVPPRRRDLSAQGGSARPQPDRGRRSGSGRCRAAARRGSFPRRGRRRNAAAASHGCPAPQPRIHEWRGSLSCSSSSITARGPEGKVLADRRLSGLGCSRRARSPAPRRAARSAATPP